MSKYDELKQLVIAGEDGKVPDVVRSLLESGSTPMEIMSEGLMAGMTVVSEKFKAEDMFIPEVLIAADAMNAGMKIIKPLVIEDETGSLYKGKVVGGTVEGDIHDIGKQIVDMLMESNGFEIIDLGVDTPADKFVTAVREEKPDLLLMSAMLTTTMAEMKVVIEALKNAGLRDKVKVMVGGVSVTNRYAEDIGADGFAPDAISAVEKMKEILNIK